MKKYYPKPGQNIITKKNAQIVGEFLEKHFPDGFYEKSKIIELAKFKGSPIHGLFEWDDTKAAARYRLLQATKIVNCLYVKIEKELTPAAVSVISVRDDGSKYRTYVSTDIARRDENLFDQVTNDAIKALDSWCKRFSVLEKIQKFSPIFRHVEIITKELRK